MGLFDKRREIPQRELKNIVRNSSGRIPGSGGKRFSRLEREKIVRDVFGSRYGSIISKDDYRIALRNLEREKRKVTDKKKREEIEKKFRFLDELGGL